MKNILLKILSSNYFTKPIIKTHEKFSSFSIKQVLLKLFQQQKEISSSAKFALFVLTIRTDEFQKIYFFKKQQSIDTAEILVDR